MLSIWQYSPNKAGGFSLCARILVAKYFPLGDLLKAKGHFFSRVELKNPGCNAPKKALNLTETYPRWVPIPKYL